MPLRLPSSSLLALLTALVAACAADDPSPADGDASTGADESTGELPRDALYHEHVRPILARHCGTCHTDGAIAPFALDDYDDAREWGEVLLASVQDRTMPPFAADNAGTCNTFVDARWLTDDEIDTIAAWVEAGYPEGDASLPAPERPEPPALTGAVTSLPLPRYEPVAADGGLEDYHCFLVELDLAEPRYVTGFDVVPGDPRSVHHVLGFHVDPGFLGNEARLRELDEQTPDVPGWECFGAAGDDVYPSGVPVTWAPGTGATMYPHDVGVRFDPGDVMVVQVHYDLAAGGGPDQTEVRLAMADGVQREAVQVLWDPFLFSAQFGEPEQLAPGQEAVQFQWDESLREMMSLQASGVSFDEAELIGVLPHMHERGRRMSIALQTEAGMQCGAEIPRWDFSWQRAYFFEQPLPVRLDDRMHVTCEWSTRGDTEPVLPGFGSADEMCLVGVMLAAR